jgi:hypothetical protein
MKAKEWVVGKNPYPLPFHFGQPLPLAKVRSSASLIFALPGKLRSPSFQSWLDTLTQHLSMSEKVSPFLFRSSAL